MKTKVFKTAITGSIICILTLMIGIGIWLNPINTITSYAVETTHNTELNVNEVRIDGWRTLRDMTIYGPNTDWGCGMTAIGILLQYYNDNSRYAGEILPNDFNYALGSDENDKQARANALRGYSLDDIPRTAPPGYTTERDDDLFRLTPKLAIGSLFDNGDNATLSSHHRVGLERFFQIHCPNLNIGIEEQTHVLGINSNTIKNQIDNNKPVILSMLLYNDTYHGENPKQKFHVVVAYGYRVVDGKLEFLAHSGWEVENGTEIWFSPHGGDTFVIGYSSIDVPLDRFNVTTISGGSAVRIDGLKRNATGNLLIPSHINGRPVTEIGNNAFSWQTGVTSVTFAKDSGVTAIGSSAFSGMTNLASITLPNSVKTIGNSAFYNCTALAKINLSDSLKTIGSSAFSNCIALSKILIPSYVTSIGDNAFLGCINLREVSFGKNNLINISNDTTVEYSNDFYKEMPLNINLVAGVTYTLSFSYYGFQSSTASLTDVFTSIGVGETALSMELPAKDVNKLPEEQENLNFKVGMGGKRDITFTPTAGQLASSKKLWVRFIQTETQQQKVSLFITNVRLEAQSQLQTIGNNAFGDCMFLSQISIPASVTALGSSFAAHTRVDWQGNYSFRGSEFLGILGGQTSFVIPSVAAGRAVTSIGYNAFQSDTSLTALTIPKSVTNVNFCAFSGCVNLSITWEYNPNMTAGNFSQYLTKVIFPAGETTISSLAFANCTKLTDITIPNTITAIGSGAFSGCTGITAFNVDGSNSNYISVGGIIYSKSANGNAGAMIVAYPAGKTAVAFTVPVNVTYIFTDAFIGCNYLQTVILPADRFIDCGIMPFDSTVKIIVPYDLLGRYQSNAYWSPYVNNFETPESLVSFNSGGGSAVTSVVVPYGKSELLPLPAKAGFTFAGWYDNNGYCYYLYTLFDSLDSEITLYAAWANRNYTVIIGDTEVTYEIIHTTFNVKCADAQIPVRQVCNYIGYNIDGFPCYFEGDSSAELGNLNGTTLYQDWRLTIEFYSEGWVVEAREAKLGTVIYTAASFIPIRAGFTFAGWYTKPYGNGAEFNEFTAYFNVKFYAAWECAINFSITNGEDLILNYSNAPVSTTGFKLTYLLGESKYTENVFGTFGTHSLISNLSISGNYSLPKNITITFKTVSIDEFGNEAIYSLDKSITFHNLFSGGTGTAGDPFTIANARHLKNIAKSSKSNYKLIQSIVLSGNWAPILCFSGVLDGNDYSILGLKISVSANTPGNYGLVATNDGTIKNLKMTAAIDINTANNPGTGVGVYAGGIAGRNNGIIQNCRTQADHIYFYNYNPDSYMGGIVGMNLGLVTDCINSLALVGYGNMGGIAGFNYGSVIGCNNNGYMFLEHYWAPSFTLSSNRSVGGIVGKQIQAYGLVYSTSTSNCTATNAIVYSYVNTAGCVNLKPYVGQIIGYKSGGGCSYSTRQNTVDVSALTGSQKDYAGQREIGWQP